MMYKKGTLLCLAICFIFFSSSQVHAKKVHAKNWDNLKDWVFTKVTTYSGQELPNIENLFINQEEDNFHHFLELEQFLTSTTTSTKSNIEFHQNEYLKQLTLEKERLLQDPLTVYTEKRKSDLEEELDYELELFLTELLKDNQ
ncbi:hypothetical protein BACCIP111883_02974 [Sutcliffiella rhizosphaerae]|uniref:Uncharacterized protein n=2 Tax=Sutcliffiella rhizosphaerae TaxID=2880967 RepID=A0ABM8YQ96_9BACI|nr:hypothetical protein BACCIP111883_02974 [Sutcliffiella rhizosphaerae]